MNYKELKKMKEELEEIQEKQSDAKFLYRDITKYNLEKLETNAASVSYFLCDDVLKEYYSIISELLMYVNAEIGE